MLAAPDVMRASWAADTCSPDDLARAGWHPDNPAWGHCDITALLVNDLFGVVEDPNVFIQETKVITCDVRPGPRPRGAELTALLEEVRSLAGITPATNTEMASPEEMP